MKSDRVTLEPMTTKKPTPNDPEYSDPVYACYTRRDGFFTIWGTGDSESSARADGESSYNGWMSWHPREKKERLITARTTRSVQWTAEVGGGADIPVVIRKGVPKIIPYSEIPALRRRFEAATEKLFERVAVRVKSRDVNGLVKSAGRLAELSNRMNALIQELERRKKFNFEEEDEDP